MASRLARNAIGVARLRPVVSARPFTPICTTLTTHRYASKESKVPSEPPAKRAQALIDSLPGNSVISKTAIVSASASLAAYLISNEYYVVNEETVVMVATLSTIWAIFHFLGPGFNAWAHGHIERQHQIIVDAQKRQVESVEERLENVKKLRGVVDVTKGLFEVSKETAELEAQAYELEQKTAVAAEAKSVLDSWVRFEGQQKAKQQREMAESIIAKIQKELENPKTLQQILQQSVVDVEKIVASKAQ